MASAWRSRGTSSATPSPTSAARAAAGAPRALRSRMPELRRLAMCAAALGFLAALAWEPSWTWIPLIALTWALGIAADAVERGGAELRVRLAIYARRALSVVLVFQYV